MITCSKCGSENIRMERDQRGLPVAYCNDCDTRIKNMSTSEVIEYFEQNSGKTNNVDAPVAESEDNRPPCKYCTEKYVMERGDLRTRIVYVPVEPEYCPMCGRKLLASDKSY